MAKWKKLFFITVSILFLENCFLIGKRCYYAHSFNPAVVTRERIVWDSVRSILQAGLTIDSTSIVFVGTSLTEGFPVSEYFGSRNAKNRGISGNTLPQIKKRIVDYVRYKPWKVFLEGGINDIKDGYPADTIIANYKQILDSIHMYSPETKICIQSVLPTSGQYAYLNKQISDLNTMLEGLRNNRDVIFLNICAGFEEHNAMPERYTYDGLHLNEEGYEKWRDIIAIYIYTSW